MRDGLIRRAVKAVARWAKTCDLAITRWVLARRGEPRYRLGGTCNGCGRCCEEPSMPVSRAVWYSTTVRWLFVRWQQHVNGFVLVGADPRFKVLSFRCTHYDASTKRCDSYDSRPLMCRDYPKNLIFEPVPELFAECSHTVHDKKAGALKDALRAAGVDGEKLREIEAKLFLGDDPRE